jgi:hypothetical protein
MVMITFYFSYFYFFKHKILSIPKGRCVACDQTFKPGCARCDQNGCKECIDGYILKEDTEDELKLKCYPCSDQIEDCQSCEYNNDVINCKKCNDNFFLTTDQYCTTTCTSCDQTNYSDRFQENSVSDGSSNFSI